MKSILNFSEADLLAFHCMGIIAKSNNKAVTTKEVAKILNASENHLSKVLQRLTKTGLLKSIRGPNGGFSLNKNASEISLMDIFEAIQGPFSYSKCLMNCEECPFNECLFNGFYEEINKRFQKFFSENFLKEN